MGTSEYKPLFTGLDSDDAQKLSAQLDAEGIPHQTSSDGKTISVPSDKLDAARLKTAADGQPHSGHLGFELFDKMSWGETEFDQKVAYQRAMEGELARTIETLSDVQSARVHIVMPTDSIFLDKQRGAKASVILKLRGHGLPKASAVAISRMVAGAVDELAPEDVSIVDADSARSLGVRDNDPDDNEGLDATLTQRLITTLEPVVGADRVKATVKVDHNLGSSEENEEKYDPNTSALLSVQRSEDTAGGVPSGAGGAVIPAGVPGTSSNVPTSKDGKTAAMSGTPVPLQSSKTESATYGVNKVVIHTVNPSGEVQRVSAAILIDDAIVKNVRGDKVTYTRQKRSPEELTKIQEIAEAVIGFDAKRGDTISVENMSFDSDPIEPESQAPAWTDIAQKTVKQYSSVFKPLSLLLLFAMAYLLVLLPIQKQVLATSAISAAEQAALTANQNLQLPAAATPEILDGVKRAAQLKAQAVELVRHKPGTTVQALHAWLQEEQS
jgi:flagellar M-ring protein FliF